MNFHRQLDVLDVPRLARTPITVIGAGAVGSFTVLALAKCGAERITVWDDDSIESHNLPNQWYRLADLGRPKVQALKALVLEMTGVDIEIAQERFQGEKATEALGDLATAPRAARARAALRPEIRAGVSQRLWDASNAAVAVRVAGRGGGSGGHQDPRHATSPAAHVQHADDAVGHRSDRAAGHHGPLV